MSCLAPHDVASPNVGFPGAAGAALSQVTAGVLASCWQHLRLHLSCPAQAQAGDGQKGLQVAVLLGARLAGQAPVLQGKGVCKCEASRGAPLPCSPPAGLWEWLCWPEIDTPPGSSPPLGPLSPAC